jgi:hypothetical protein
MNIVTKERSIVLAREIHEALETLDVALTGGAEEREIIEAKNIVTNVLRSHKSFLESLSGSEKEEVQKLFTKKIEDMAAKAKSLK